jgi:hypothetical protein
MSAQARKQAKPASADTKRLPEALRPPVAAGLVFVAAGSVLVLEILAVRLLAPYVGLTLEATTAIIGAALAGISVGAAVGGYLADRTNTRQLVVALLILGGILSLLTVPVVRWLGPGVRGDGGIATLGVTLVALVPAAAVLSAVSPAVAHLQLHDLKASGTIVGRLSAWATAGALLGTFGTGFVLVPLLPTSVTVLLVGALLILVGIGLGVTSRLLPAAATAGVLVVALMVGGASAAFDSPCDTETKYHCVRLEQDPKRPTAYSFILDDLYHSYVDVDDPTYLKFPYVQWITESIDSAYPEKEPLDAVFVGGGGFTIPRWLLATRPGSQADVIEVDGELVDFVEDRFGVRPSKNLEISIGDGRLDMLDVPDDSADVVVGDAFGGDSVPWHLATTEWAEEVQRVLKPGGLYALNVIDFQPLDLMRAEAATLLETFADVRLITYTYANGGLYGGNIILLASDKPMSKSTGSKAKYTITASRPEVERYAGNAETLRDDFAPADQLLTSDEP